MSSPRPTRYRFRRPRIPRWIIALLFLIVLALLIALAGCARVKYTETTTSPEGLTTFRSYAATKANPLGKTDSQAESFKLEQTDAGTGTVETGQAIESQDNSQAGAVLIEMLELLLPYIAPEPSLDDLLTVPE